MSSHVTVVNRLPEFSSSVEAAFDRCLNNLGVDILRLSKLQAPHLHGQLRASGRLERKGVMKFEVSYNTPYAAYQEYGSWPDGSHQIKQHTEGGTKTHYLKDPGDQFTEEHALLERFKSAGIGISML